MKVNISQDEYRQLLDVFQIADWVMRAHRTEEDPRTARYQPLQQRLLGLAPEMGCPDLVTGDAEQGFDYADELFADGNELGELVEEYDDEVFWGDLVNRLAHRDLARRCGSWEAVMDMAAEERLRQLHDLVDRYDDVLATQGLDALEVQLDNEAPAQSP
ncbi:MAG: hypothetical protein AB1634_10070 [Thermodesulfobacteriota bacterium]